MRSSVNQEIYVKGTKKYGLTVSGSSSAAASLPNATDLGALYNFNSGSLGIDSTANGNNLTTTGTSISEGPALRE